MSEFGSEAQFRSGLEPGDLAKTIRHCGSTDREGPVTDESGREREGPHLEKQVHKAPFSTQVPSATCGAREGLRQRAPTGPIGCKTSSTPSWIAEEVGNTKDKERKTE